MAILNEIINLNDDQVKIIKHQLDKNGKLTCINAMNVAQKLNLKTTQMSDACKSINIKISDCELGVFGNIDFGEFKHEIYQTISKKFKENTDVSCATLWNIGKKETLRIVGSTTKNSDIEVINCQLGCFSKRKAHR